MYHFINTVVCGSHLLLCVWRQKLGLCRLLRVLTAVMVQLIFGRIVLKLSLEKTTLTDTKSVKKLSKNRRFGFLKTEIFSGFRTPLLHNSLRTHIVCCCHSITIQWTKPVPQNVTLSNSELAFAGWWLVSLEGVRRYGWSFAANDWSVECRRCAVVEASFLFLAASYCRRRRRCFFRRWRREPVTRTCRRAPEPPQWPRATSDTCRLLDGSLASDLAVCLSLSWIHGTKESANYHWHCFT